jgi:hypothetical protein
MITEKDLQDAIAECQGERKPNASTCIKLAAFFTIYDHLYPKQAELTQEVPQAIFRTVDDEIIADYGDTEFYKTIRGRKAAEVWDVMNELMDTLKVINPRLYDGVMRQLL